MYFDGFARRSGPPICFIPRTEYSTRLSISLGRITCTPAELVFSAQEPEIAETGAASRRQPADDLCALRSDGG